MRLSLRRVIFNLIAGGRNVSLAKVIVMAFLAIIIVGALLLSLPVAARSGESTTFTTALFTATSATCVTGLVLVDTFTYWSGFGQVVILILIQIGGLGFMTVASLFSFLINRKIGMRERLIMVQALNLNEIDGVVRLVRHVLIATFTFELAGAVILSFCFIGDYGIVGGIVKGVFHSISAFCNAGFDIFGDQAPFCSLSNYAGHPVVNITVMALVVIGGLGFFVWEDIYRTRKFNRLRLHTKLVLIITAILIFGGAAFFFAFEYGNPATMGDMNFGQRLLASFFQSVTTRTAGFSTIDQGAMNDVSKVFTMLFMTIGGSSGSTAGGIKTVTFGVLILSAVSVIRSREEVTAFGRSIPRRHILAAMTIALMAFVFCIGSSMAVSFIENIPYISALFETASAFGTVGLSTGITAALSVPSQFILIVLMFFGRVGLMTISAAIIMKRPYQAKIRYPKDNVLIG